MTYKLNPFTGKLDTSDGPQGPAGVVSAAGPGSQGTPSISFAADLDTGLYNYTANAIAVSTGGTGRLFIDSSGRVGIGTTSPSQKLDISTGYLNFTDNYGIRWGGVTSTALYANSTDNFIGFQTSGGERVRIDSSGRLLVGTSSSRNVGHTQEAVVQTFSSVPSQAAFTFGYNNASGTILALAKSRSSVIGTRAIVNSSDVLGDVRFAGDDGVDLESIGASIRAEVDGTPGADDMPGRLVFSTTADGASSSTERMRITQAGSVRPGTDNTQLLGSGSFRWAEVYAGNATINTSDVNLKQDIESLDAAELTVATAIKGLIKKYRFTDAVNVKGDDARIHVGVIAQEVEQAFLDAGLDASRYALFCRDTWYEVDGNEVTADTPGAIEKTRLGIRYAELLAFIIAAM